MSKKKKKSKKKSKTSEKGNVHLSAQQQPSGSNDVTEMRNVDDASN